MTRFEGPEDAMASRGNWLGRAFVDPDGVRLGHVVAVEPDGFGGAYVEVQGDWGALDFLASFGGMKSVHRCFRFHSDELDDSDPGKLILKRSALSGRRQ